MKIIANELETPQPFLAKLLQQLTRSKFVSSTKGPNGGFYLDKKNRKNTLWDIVKNVDGTDKFEQCFLGLSKCGDKNPCPAHSVVAPFKEKIIAHFNDKNIEQCAEEIKSSGKYLSLKEFDAIDDI